VQNRDLHLSEQLRIKARRNTGRKNKKTRRRRKG